MIAEDVSLGVAAEVAEPEPRSVDLQDPALFLNRELTWLAFNRRVLAEAEAERNPLLERVKFLAIVANTLDEFFMKRIGGLKQQVGAGMQDLSVDGRTPAQQIVESLEMVKGTERRARELLARLTALLADEQIHILGYDDLEPKVKKALREHYEDNVFPLVTPQSMDPAHPFPFVSNLSVNLLVTLLPPGEDHPVLARVKVPVGTGTPRLVVVPGLESTFVALEDIIAHNLDLLFPGMEVLAWELFRVTRNANTESDEDRADDLLAMIESELRERKFAPIVRLEVQAGMDSARRGMLAAELHLNEYEDVFEVDGMIGMADLFEIAALNRSELCFPPHHPLDHPSITIGRSIFHTIREAKSILLHHPFDSFATSVERLLAEASSDPKVRAIKMTLYRTSSHSRVVRHLVEAARNGKQVAVVVELKARFDEQANIRWAERLEQVGIHVTYGVVGLKTHCKTILIVRQDFSGLTCYAHIGTGNYHSGTARAYTDLGLLTCDRHVGRDLTELFNYLTTGYKPKRDYKRILVAPKLLKSGLLERIQREIDSEASGKGGSIRWKTNALEDADVCRALYKASMAGVRIELAVRDTCRLRPGVPGVSENITVVSVLGRFLEHSRIIEFGNSGKPEYFIGSADAMKRNLESRVEVLVPVSSKVARAQLAEVLDLVLSDPFGWEEQPDGSYEQRATAHLPASESSQSALVSAAESRYKNARRSQKRRPKAKRRRKTDA